MIKNIKKILVILGPGIGDTILTIPLITTLRKNLPNATINGINWISPMNKADKSSAEIIKKYFKLNKLISVDIRLSFFEKLKILLKIMHTGYDLVIDCYPGTDKTALFAFFVGKYKAGFDFNKKYSFLYNTKIKPKKENKVELEQELLKKIGFKIEKIKLKTNTNEEKNINSTNNYLQKEGIKSAIGVSFARAKFHLRTWQNEKWAEILDKIIDNNKKELIFIGSIQNKERMDSVIKLMKNKKIHFFLDHPLDETATLISKLNLFLTENNGIMHLASITNVPLIAICGPSFYGWGPYGDNCSEIRGSYPCGGPCDSGICRIKSNICIKGISVDKVWKEIKKKLSSSSK
jgi:heptosyltransferase-2